MIKIESIGNTRRITLDRPERRNALGAELINSLSRALHDAQQDDEVRAVVLCAAPPAFCAGSDLKELAGLSIEDMCRHEADTAAIARGFGALTKPLIAAVEGYALGGGFILACSCDVIISATDTRWHLPEVANGWVPPWGLQALVARVGVHKARWLTWGVEAIDGARAYDIGLADLLCENGAADQTAMELAEKFAALPAHSVASCKRFYDAFWAPNGEFMDRAASKCFADDCLNPRAQEILSRFGAKK